MTKTSSAALNSSATSKARAGSTASASARVRLTLIKRLRRSVTRSLTLALLLSSSELQRVRINQFPRVPCQIARLPLQIARAAPARLLRREAVRGSEVVAPGRVDEARVDFGASSLEEADVRHAVEQVARLAGFHLPLFEHVVVEQVVEARLLDLEAARVRGALENLDVGRGRRRLDARAVAHAPQERLVNQVLLVEVRREDDQLLKRHLDLLSGVQSQVVDALL